MRKVVGWMIVLGVAASPALAQTIHIDYAHDFDFDKVKTFQFVETKDTDVGNPMMDDRVKAAIIEQLTAGELKQVEADPDMFVTYHFTSKDNTVLNTSSMGYGGWGGGWGGWGGYGGMGMGSSTTTATTYTEGTLILDAYDSTDKKMVWRGTGTVTVKAKPEKQIQQINNILVKMGKKWDKILHGQGK